MWDFAKLRKFAIRAIAKNTGPATHVRIALAYDVKALLMPAYVDLCAKMPSLTYEEASELGMRLTLDLVRIRDELRGVGAISREVCQQKISVSAL